MHPRSMMQWLMYTSCPDRVGMDTLAEWLRRRPAKPMGSPRVGSNPTGVDVSWVRAYVSHHPRLLSTRPIRPWPASQPTAIGGVRPARARHCGLGSPSHHGPGTYAEASEDESKTGLAPVSESRGIWTKFATTWRQNLPSFLEGCPGHPCRTYGEPRVSDFGFGNQVRA